MSALALAAVAAGLAGQPCLRDGERITGRFGWVDARHPNGQRMHDPFVTLARPRCFEDSMGRAEGRAIQLAFDRPTDARRLRTGALVTVEAEYMVPHTAWHIGDIVALHARVVATAAQPKPRR